MFVHFHSHSNVGSANLDYFHAYLFDKWNLLLLLYSFFYYYFEFYFPLLFPIYGGPSNVILLLPTLIVIRASILYNTYLQLILNKVIKVRDLHSILLFFIFIIHIYLYIYYLYFVFIVRRSHLMVHRANSWLCD